MLRTAKCHRHVDQDYRSNEIDWHSKFIIINSDINSLYCGQVLQASPLPCGSSWVSWHTTLSTRLGVWVIDIFFIYLSVHTFIDIFKKSSLHTPQNNSVQNINLESQTTKQPSLACSKSPWLTGESDWLTQDHMSPGTVCFLVLSTRLNKRQTLARLARLLFCLFFLACLLSDFLASNLQWAKRTKAQNLSM